jgi:hypothetical protein
LGKPSYGFSNPLASELARDCETPSLILLRKWPCFVRFAQKSSGEKHWVALGLQAGRCCEKASASPLASVFSAINPAFAQRINPVLLVLPIRENRSHPWLKAILNLAARMTAVVRGNDSLPAARNPLLSFV